jgi:hypothetical protein
MIILIIIVSRFVAGIEFAGWHPKTSRSLILDLFMPYLVLLCLIVSAYIYRTVRDWKQNRVSRKEKKKLLGYIALAVTVAVFFAIIRSIIWSASEIPNDPDGIDIFSPRKLLLFLTPHVGWLFFYSCVYFEILVDKGRGIREIWTKSATHDERHILDVTDYGLRLTNPFSVQEVQWFGFKTFIESTNLLVSITSDYLILIIPKRAFADESQLNEFRQILVNNITNRPVAFPVVPIRKAEHEANDAEKME